MKDKDYQELFQGRRKNQLEFSYKVVSLGYYGIILSILCFMLYQYL